MELGWAARSLPAPVPWEPLALCLPSLLLSPEGLGNDGVPRGERLSGDGARAGSATRDESPARSSVPAASTRGGSCAKGREAGVTPGWGAMPKGSFWSRDDVEHQPSQGMSSVL